MIGDAISYPTNSEDWIKNILIGGACMLFSWLVVPGLIASGYYVRVIRSVAREEETPPPFDLNEWIELATDGFKLFIATLGYMLVPGVVFGILVGVSIVLNNVLGQTIGLIVALIIQLPAFLIWLIVIYGAPAAITNVALTGRIGAAFEYQRIVEVAFTKRYFVTVVLSYVVGVVGGFIAVFFLLAFVVGYFIALFYLNLVTNYLIARGVGPCLRTGPPKREEVSSSGSPSP